MSETAYTPVVVLVLLVAWSALERPRLRLFAGLGALIGVAALVRSEALLLLPLLAWPVAVARRLGLAAARARRLAHVRGRARPVDDPQRDRVRPPDPDLDQRLDRPARRELRRDLRRAGHRLLAPGLHPVAALRQRGRPGGVLARRRAGVRPRARRAARGRRPGAGPAHVLALPAAPPGAVRRGPLGPRRAGRRGVLLPARAALDRRARSRCGAAACRCWSCSRRGAVVLLSVRRSATAIRGCGTCSSRR